MQGRAVRPDSPCQTPNFDRAAARGVRFERAYTPNPTCSPARASLMTGLLPHNHGVLQVEHCVDKDQSVLREDKPHWAQRLVEAGYHTGYFGKWHIERSFDLERYGWQVNGCRYSEPYKRLRKDFVGPEDQEGRFLLSHYIEGPAGYERRLHYAVTPEPVEKRKVSVPVRLAQEFLSKGRESHRPWCCVVSFTEPNEAMVCSQETYALYDPDRIDLPPNMGDEMADKPAIYARSRAVWNRLSERQWREARVCYYARITELDRLFGTLIQTLEDMGVLDDTIVVVSSDHGKYVGGHGLEAHNFGAFEEITNIPMIVSGPGIGAHGGVAARLGLHDLCPTLLDLTGCEPIRSPDSRSFAPLLRDPKQHGSAFQTGYAEYHGTRFPLAQRVYWDGDWKFVFNGFDNDELYNIKDDPFEMINRASDPACQDRVMEMMRQIWKRVRETGDQSLLNSHYYSLRFASVGPDG